MSVDLSLHFCMEPYSILANDEQVYPVWILSPEDKCPNCGGPLEMRINVTEFFGERVETVDGERCPNGDWLKYFIPERSIGRVTVIRAYDSEEVKR